METKREQPVFLVCGGVGVVFCGALEMNMASLVGYSSGNDGKPQMECFWLSSKEEELQWRGKGKAERSAI